MGFRHHTEDIIFIYFLFIVCRFKLLGITYLKTAVYSWWTNKAVFLHETAYDKQLCGSLYGSGWGVVLLGYSQITIKMGCCPVVLLTGDTETGKSTVLRCWCCMGLFGDRNIKGKNMLLIANSRIFGNHQTPTSNSSHN